MEHAIGASPGTTTPLHPRQMPVGRFLASKTWTLRMEGMPQLRVLLGSTDTYNFKLGLET